MKKILLLAAIFCLALSGAMVSCYFDAARDNPNDPESGELTGVIYIFSTEGHTGNLGGRAGADNLCSSTRTSNYSSLPSINIHAFISAATGDAITDMPQKYGVPTNRKISSHTNKIIANNWNDLFDGIEKTLLEADVISDATDWWSGSNSNGTFYATKTCNGWISDSSGFTGATGGNNTTSTSWLLGTIPSCDAPDRHVLCICWE